MKYVDAVADVSVNDVKLDLMQTAYDNDRALLNTFDPRVVLLWTVLFMFVPWLFYRPEPLAALLVAALVLAALSQVSKYLMALLLFGQVTNIGLFILLIPVVTGVTAGFDVLAANLDPNALAAAPSVVATAALTVISTAAGNLDLGVGAVGPLLPFFLKLAIISVVSLAVFSAMSPEKLSTGMLRLGVPRQLTFAITYGYRMMPVLVEEYHNLINSFRLRSEVPENKGILKWRYFAYLLVLSAKAFYPLIFNVAKRARVTVEAMETKGFSHSLGDEQSRALRTDQLEIQPRDVTFVTCSLLFVVLVSVVL